MERLRVYGDRTARIVAESIALARVAGFEIVGETDPADVAIAPLLRRKLTPAELEEAPTLIFHPSLLPRHRGRDAIRWAFEACESYSGVTWFWADDGYDTGDICEQGVVEIHRSHETPRQFYERAVDEGLRLLAFALADLRSGVVRSRPQREVAHTYEPPMPRTAHSAGESRGEERAGDH